MVPLLVLLLVIQPAASSDALTVLFPPGAQLSAHGALALWGELRRGPESTLPARSSADCLRDGERPCWTSAPCDRMKSLSGEDYDSQNDSMSNANKDCDMLLFYLDGDHVESRTNDSSERPTPIEVWGYGLLSTGLISLSGIGGIILHPIMTKGYFNEVMNFLIGLAFGSLSATSIFQLLPESFGVMEFDENYITKALICWGSIWLFYNIGVFTTLISGKRKHSHGHSHNNKRVNHDVHSLTDHQPTMNGLEMTTTKILQDEEENNGFLNAVERADSIKEEKVKSKKITAVMIIFGDGLHNFVDGMSIGAGFSQSLATGLSISLGVACEEFPHEFGDFAVLMKSGFSFKKALKFNYASACTIFLGLITGILLGQLDASIYIYAFAGGLFLYISLGELVPELKEMINEEKKNGLKSSLVAYTLQNLGMLIGSLALFLVTKYL
ncbi:metal cation symporter ZIP14-like [Ischnura elegans]|uniref:metal cation symporter ZIP14-like n=1 Tax=Ischnura elegans TaxID=197161 RepID=UPI001ED8A7A9|nr:metal cation symporter ZIP14-like [Ischnura elegans]